MPKAQPLPKKLLTILEKSGTAHAPVGHRTVYTAFDLAMTLGRPEKEVAKALFVKAGPITAIAVVGADRRLNTLKLGVAMSKAARTKLGEAKILNEKAIMKLTGLGDRPTAAFGSLYDVPVVVDAILAKQRKVVFAAGSVNISLEMLVKDFLKHEQATVASFTEARPKQKKGASKKVTKASSKNVKVKKSTAKPAKKNSKKVAKKAKPAGKPKSKIKAKKTATKNRR